MRNKKNDLKRLIFNVASLVDLGQEVTSSKGLARQMKAALYVVTGMLSVPTAVLYVYNGQNKRFELLVQKGHKNLGGQDAALTATGTSLRAFRPNEPYPLKELQEAKFFARNSEVFARLGTRIFIPLFAKDQFVGALALGRKLGHAGYRDSERDVLRVVAHQLAITLCNTKLFLEVTRKAAENKRLYEGMRRIYHDTIQAFSAAIDAKDEYTRDHSYRVACYAVAIARELGWKKRDLEGIYVAGLLHDIGKIIIDTRIITKGEELTATELSQIKKHPQISYAILSKIKFPWKNIERFVRHHHERPDGKGYPDSLHEPELSDGSKILALADAFDAMTTDRPYRQKMGIEEAFSEMLRCSGSQFDPRITDTFFTVLRKELGGHVKEPQILPFLQRPNAEIPKGFSPANVA